MYARGRELARARAARLPYRLMLLDYHMPDMDGVEVARKATEAGFARASPGGQAAIILMLTPFALTFSPARVRGAALPPSLHPPPNRADHVTPGAASR